MAQRLRLTLLGLWLGAMAFFTTSVARAAFAVLPTRRMAGDLVSPVLANLEYAGLVVSLLLILILLFSREGRRRAWLVEMALYLTAFMGTIVARFIISARIHGLRAEFGDRLEALAMSDPIRIHFGQLHAVSVSLTGLNMLVALVAILILIAAGRR